MAVLKIGSKGSPVTQLQEKLGKAGIKPKLKVDGIFGKQTAEAVKAFQKKNKLKPDGIVGKKSEAALGLGRAKNKVQMPKKAVQGLKDLERVLDDHLGATWSTADKVEKVQKELKKKGNMSKQEAAKHVKPLYAMVDKIEKKQKTLTAGIMKHQNLLSELNQSPDPAAKKLLKMGQIMDATGKKYISYSKSTKKRGAAFLDKLAKNELKSVRDAWSSFNSIYTNSTYEKYSEAWYELTLQAK